MSSSSPSSSPTSNLESQLNFLLQILQTIYDSEGDPQVVYPLLQANIDKLDDNFAYLFRIAPVMPKSVAAVIGIFGRLIHHFPKGKKSINLEIAITAFETASRIFTYEAFPKLWAENQVDLGSAYFDRIKGDHLENLEKAIAAFESAFQVYTLENFPTEWANIQNYLGSAYIGYAYCDWIQEENRAKKLDQGIAALEAALQVYTLKQFPQDWVMIQSNLATAYSIRLNGDRAKNIERAIDIHKAMLQVYTHEAFPEQWANTQNNLGNTYCDQFHGDRVQNLNQAILAFQSALQVYTRERFPEQWASTNNNLGLAYSDQGQLLEAIACFRAALQILTPDAFPIDCLMSGRNLGNTTFTLRRWEEAIESYGVAIEAVEQSREWASRDSRKAEILSAAIDVYNGIVQAYIKNNKPKKAIEYIERSKTRNLVELLSNKDIYPKHNLYPTTELFQTHCHQLEQLRRQIPAIERELEILIRESEEKNRDQIEQRRQQLAQLQQQRDELLAEINQLDSSFTFTQKVQPIPFSDIQSLTDENTTIVEWYITGSQILTFIVTRHHPHPIVVASENMTALENWDKDYRHSYQTQNTQWINNLASGFQNLAEILHIDEIISRIDQCFSESGAKCNRLILIPHRYLHLFPLHALPLVDGKLLFERFPKGVGYAPSCQLLKQAKDQEQHRPDFTRLFAIQNPTRQPARPLLGSQLEIDKIRQHFDLEQTIILKETEATEANLYECMEQMRSSHCIHFSCHGKFYPESPLKSALLLADPEGKLGEEANLTLGEVFEKLYLNQCRLVTFSACESGMTDPNSISDEYIGLPSGFLYAGSLSIVSTLWTVDPIATILLMVKFYRNLKRLPQIKTGDVAIALNKAQKWLRALTYKKWTRIQNNPQFQRLMEEAFANSPTGDFERKKFKKSLSASIHPNRQPLPFANPYYWSAFVAIGI